VLGKLGKEEQIITNVDEIISTTGSRPNFKFLRVIRFDRDPAIECAPKLVDIINPQKGIVPPHGEERLRQPEEGFYIIRSEEHTSELQSRFDLVCRLLLEKKKEKT